MTKYIGVKRALDFILALLAILILSPVFVLVAILIKLDSKGPIIFSQERMGKDLRKFTIYKFRTMKVDSKPVVREDGTMITDRNDARVTRIGKFLRRGLDELPQFYNILIGEMSIVGPRPDLPHQVADFNEKQLIKYTVRPGITNLPAVSGRNDIMFEQRIEMDIKYINNLNLFTDLKIMVLTVLILLGINTGK